MIRYLRSVLLALGILATSVLSAQAAPLKEGPFGVDLVLLHECRIDFDQVLWIGDHTNPGLQTEKAAMQVAWLVAQLPSKCFEDRCVFDNITYQNAHIYDALLIVRFMEHLPSQMANQIAEAMEGCRIQRPSHQSLSEGASGVLSCSGGNTLTLTVSDSSNVSFTSAQAGCNVGDYDIRGKNITVTIIQIGANHASIRFYGDDITFQLTQQGSQSYSATITGGTHTITQAN